ncbi:hypothetical protein JQ543_12520 [Bradyrhizobium diazoefficiens]|nr:hypothetical protein [Bradyrhizobium diazoefficiens]MBR0773396.1 hypothetical protein [Bradyrhizobium diazoefficiens]MBR0848568.1 hypothetical protein [Bradyrhizobium diazoefficiens]
MAASGNQMAVEAGAKAQKAAGLTTFSWWSRGGEPGPGYTSDKLDVQIEKNGAGAHGTYIRARFDNSYEPPFLSEQYTSTVPEPLVRDLLAALERDKTYSLHFASEDRSNLADAIKDTIRLTVGEQSQEKTLYASESSELAASKAARNTIVRYLYENGSKTIRNQKKKP